jgi:hypothetical protein
MIPLVITYHLKILNAAGAFTDPLFDSSRIPTRVIAASLPGMGALALLGWNFRRIRQAGRTVASARVAILSAWLGLPVLFIVRHFGCGSGGTSAVCTAFVLPVHHWMFYLQSALACVFGYAVVSGLAPRSVSLATVSATGALVLACALLAFRPMDEQMRQRAIDMRSRVDLELYQWMLKSTQPGALFVTDISTNAVHDSAAIAVLAAGRKSVALPFTYSNPYIDWQTRKERGDSYLAAARPGGDKGTLCRLLTEAGHGNPVYIALEAGARAAPPGQLQLAFRSKQNDLYSVMPFVCAPGEVARVEDGPD